jgi:acyl dehydratase
MAYAAALGEAGSCYLDTRARPDVVAHPLFPVCIEWPVFLGVHELRQNSELTAKERTRGVHISHDLVLHRPLHAEQRLVTQARVVAVERRSSGAYQLVRLDTTLEAGDPVCTTWYGSLYRGVEVRGEDRRLEAAPRDARTPPKPSEREEVELEVPATAAHVYSECARIWNPIHTDAAVAARAGLPGLILHGTATLALAVSAVVGLRLKGDPQCVASVTGDFRAMVTMPSTLRVGVFDSLTNGAIPFEVLNDRGETAICDGLLGVRS